MGDKYDDAVASLTEHPEQIFDAWGSPNKLQEGCLFQMCGGRGEVLPSLSHDADGKYSHEIGCPTMIENGGNIALTPSLTDWIREQPIPNNARMIEAIHLPAFATIQRKLDAEIPGRGGK